MIEPKVKVNGKSTLYKTIYVKPKKLKWGQKETNEVLTIEIQEHLKKYPDMEFLKTEAEKNNDQSITYTMSFIPKKYIS